jgi:Phage integrase family.
VQVSGYGKKFGLKYKPKRDIPKFVKEYHSFSPSKIREIVLGKRNKNVTAESITMWFKRNPETYAQLKAEVIGEQLPKLEVSETIFDNGTFEELPSVKKWIQTLEDRHVKAITIQRRVGTLKRICKGYNLNRDEWSYRHPDRITEDDFKEYNRKIRAKGLKDTDYRSIERNFLLYSKQKVPTISGHITLGKYSDLYVPRETLNQIFNEIKAQDYVVYVASKFCFKNGAREKAVLNAETKNLNLTERTIVLHEKRKARQEFRKEIKYIDDELLQDLKPLIAKGTKYLFEGLTRVRWCNICREAYEKIIPELNKRIPMPVHFWRHMFAQHMLRATDWNYGIVAGLGGWTEEALKRSYGQPPQAVIAKWGMKYIPQI